TAVRGGWGRWLRPRVKSRERSRGSMRPFSFRSAFSVALPAGEWARDRATSIFAFSMAGRPGFFVRRLPSTFLLSLRLHALTFFFSGSLRLRFGLIAVRGRSWRIGQLCGEIKRLCRSSDYCGYRSGTVLAGRKLLFASNGTQFIPRD